MDQIELFNHLTMCKQITEDELLVLYGITWNHLTVRKQMINIKGNS